MTLADDLGPVDLTNCDREPIHILGAIQPVGFLLALTADWLVARASTNLADFLDLEPADMLGLPLAGVGLLLAVDPIVDMGRTALNVAGQALVPTIVAKRMGILDQDRYDSVSAAGLPEIA